jgi:acyl carrier protein
MVCAAGESCPADLAATFAHYEFWNLYGPTETTIWATAGRASFGSRVTIGRPIRNTETLVVDSKGRPVPVGVAGELWVSGPGVARGYLNQPDRTAERFVTDHPILKGRSYRTGDVVRQIRDGGLVFLGRADRQTKIRGVRIELEEIESVLRGVVGVLEAVAEAVPIDGQATLVAYVQIAPGTDPESTIQTCRALLRSSLPIHMSPSRFVPVASFARSAGGKIDRKSLPLPEATLAPARTRLLPRTTAERQVADLMAHVLRVNGLGADDDFFHVGGHSLAAVRLASRARAVFGVTLSIADIFSHSTVAELASFIEGLKGMGQQSTDQEFPLQRLPRVPANASGRD